MPSKFSIQSIIFSSSLRPALMYCAQSSLHLIITAVSMSEKPGKFASIRITTTKSNGRFSRLVPQSLDEHID